MINSQDSIFVVLMGEYDFQIIIMDGLIMDGLKMEKEIKFGLLGI